MRKLRSKKEHAEYMQEWKAANPDAVRSYSRKYYEKNKNSEEFKRKAADSGYKNRHGISLAQYEEILKSQNGCCKICKKERGDKRLHLDHDHKTGEIRGILCNTCNTKLGWFELYDKEIKEYLHR